MFDVAGELWEVNRAATALLGLVLESGATDPLREVDPAVRIVLERLRSHVLGGHGPYTPTGLAEAIRVSSSEGNRYLLPRAAPVYETQGGIVGATVVLLDVTTLHQCEELTNDLVATVAHELRTPLTSLRMAIHLCLEQTVGPLTEKQVELLHAGREDCERLLRMVNSLLDLSRLEVGRIERHKHPTSIASLVQAAIETHRTLAAERGIQLGTALPLIDGEVFVDVERALARRMQMRKTYTKCERILWFGPALSKKVRNSLLAVLAFTVLLTPTYAMAAEREGTVLFFSFDDLKKALSHPSLSSLSQLSPSFAWRDLHNQAYEEGPIERDYRRGNGLGFGIYANPWVVLSW